jgi:NAD(P)-dependent dehydrogenase (short-subunit alcohol dehydrogenase family)
MTAEGVAVVAGVGPGTGRQIALTLAEQYQYLALVARDAKRLGEVSREIHTRTRRALCLPMDLTDDQQCRAAAKSIEEQYGGVDVLVHNAFSRPPVGPLADRSSADWHRALEGNVLSAMNLIYSLQPLLAQRRGSVVLVSSISARQPYELSGIYATMKAALLTLVKVLARELGRDGVRVNAVVPGYIEGPSLGPFFSEIGRQKGISMDEARTECAADTCLGRFVTPREVADAVAFLGSASATGVTGQSLDVNAGQWFG